MNGAWKQIYGWRSYIGCWLKCNTHIGGGVKCIGYELTQGWQRQKLWTSLLERAEAFAALKELVMYKVHKKILQTKPMRIPLVNTRAEYGSCPSNIHAINLRVKWMHVQSHALPTRFYELFQWCSNNCWFWICLYIRNLYDLPMYIYIHTQIHESSKSYRTHILFILLLENNNSNLFYKVFNVSNWLLIL